RTGSVQDTRVNNILSRIASRASDPGTITIPRGRGIRRNFPGSRITGRGSRGQGTLFRVVPRPGEALFRGPRSAAGDAIVAVSMPPAPAAVVTRVSRVLGRVRVPGDKSISHRSAMFAAIADGTSRIEGYLPGEDCTATLACLEGYGVPIARRQTASGLALEVQGLGLRGLRAPRQPLYAANSGTSMRLLSGLAAAHPFRTILS